jgi:TonB-dependent starch-binding outer membrane protein SusC
MKKIINYYGSYKPYCKWRKLLLTMKISAFLLFFAVINLVANPTYSQFTKISLHMKDATIEEILTNIENSSDFYFLYNQKLIDVSRKVDVSVDNVPIKDVLAEILGDDVKFVVYDRQIVLTPKDLRGNFTDFQQKQITGKVTGKDNNPLVGVSVVVKGTANGTITDIDGKYSLEVPLNAKVLSFSFIGMEPQDIAIGTANVYDVILSESVVGLEEVVVIGYGKQKKVDLTGSVAAVSSKDIEKRIVTQTSQLLTGLVSGLRIEQVSGQPGKDNVDITIRGLGTFSSAGNAPLVLVDGLASSLDNVNINDIANISVLKDAASASIYGTRGANGVILVETKKGKEGELKVSYQGSVGLQRPTALPQIVDSWVYAEMYNEAQTNAGGSPQYSDEEIAKFKSGVDPDNYPNKRHYYDLIHSGNGFQTDHHLSFSGGSAKNTYLLSLGYLDQTGLVARTYYKRYNILLNIDSKLKDNLTLNVKFSGQNGKNNEPTSALEAGGVNGLLSYALKIPNTFAGKLSNGYYGNFTGYTVEGWMDSPSFISNAQLDGVASVNLDWKIFKSLTLTGRSGYEYSMNNYKCYLPLVVVDQNITQGPASLTVRNITNSLMTLQFFMNYDLQINSHSFHLLAGYSQESNKNDWLSAYRDKFPNNSLFEINAGATSNQQNGGSASEWALRSYLGRINYNFKDKYLFEANVRYDGSSRFPKEKRYGLFPSASVGWNLSNESFFSVAWIDNLKIRGSYGKLGNQNIANYPYQQMLTLGRNAAFGVPEVLFPGAAPTVVPNINITWESTNVADLGLDISILKNKLNISADYYIKKTSGILYNITASSVLGLTPSVTNAGAVSNKGIELYIQHQNSIGPFSYSITANFSYDKNELKTLANVKQDINKGLFVGYPLESIYGYVTDGLFANQADVESSPTQPYVAAPGDIKFVDISGPEGVPDGKVDATYDRKIIGTTFPKYNYGANVRAAYKSFSLSVQLQGIFGLKKMLPDNMANAFQQGSNPQQWQVDERWTKENPNPHAGYPRFLILGGQNEARQWPSTFMIVNSAYLRIGNIQGGYNFPKAIVEKFGISDFLLYVGIKNPITLDHFRKGWDPEMVGVGYPPVSYSYIGVNVNF